MMTFKFDTKERDFHEDKTELIFLYERSNITLHFLLSKANQVSKDVDTE